MSPTQQLMIWVGQNLDENEQINRHEVKDKAIKDFGLLSTNHLYGTKSPLMVKVPGTNYGRLS